MYGWDVTLLILLALVQGSAILHCPAHKAHLSLVLLQQSRLEPIDYIPIYVMKVLYSTKSFFKTRNPISP